MTKDITKKARKLWVEALRSGKYKQGRMALRVDDRYCCLGVAVDLAIKNDIIKGRWKRSTDPVAALPLHGEAYKIGTLTYVLPVKVRQWLGLNTDSGDFNAHTLTTMNDHGASFMKIAALIESEPNGSFVK